MKEGLVPPDHPLADSERRIHVPIGVPYHHGRSQIVPWLAKALSRSMTEPCHTGGVSKSHEDEMLKKDEMT